MRFSTTSNDNTKIYELSEGLGSYATDLDSDLEENKELAKYDANKKMRALPYLMLHCLNL
ncbi:MAG: hypothetical protein L6U99_07015 [Clostridium sp.]|nr:MAG: hypothetical protein L6U99_07015 [Clostridium sp.]